MANVLRKRRTVRSCCGPFVQKLRRLEAVRANIRQLTELQSEGRQLDFALTRAADEEQRLRNWIALHEHGTG